MRRNLPTCLQTTVYGVHLCTMYIILSTVKMKVKVPPVHELSVWGSGGIPSFGHYRVVSGQFPTSAALWQGESPDTS